MSTRTKVQKWIDDGKPISVPELAKQLGLHEQTIYRTIGKLRGPKKPKLPDDLEAMLDLCRSGAISDEAANKILGRIMAEGKDADRIKAIDVYDTRNRASSSRIGPPPPQSPQQIIDRLSLMMQAADAAHIQEAAHRAGYTLVPNQPASQAKSDPPLAGPHNPADLPPS